MVIYDSSDSPGGKVKDYYLTGELQGEGEALRIDPVNDSRTLWKNTLRGYFQNGTKLFENNYNEEGLPHGSHKQWYENGLVEFEANYSAGQFMGPYQSYYPDGKLKSKIQYKNDAIVGTWTYCNWEGDCELVLEERFYDADLANRWNPIFNEDVEIELFNQTGMRILTRNKMKVLREIPFELDYSKDFSITSAINFNYGDSTAPFGLMYGYVDPHTYQYFLINAEGNYKIGSVLHKAVKETNWIKSDVIVTGQDKMNILSLVRNKETLSYLINEMPVHEDKYKPLPSNRIGISVGEGWLEAFLVSIVVRQSIK
jgi:hypothetical protein